VQHIFVHESGPDNPHQLLLFLTFYLFFRFTL
jgi:hypothetical protein